MNNTSKSLIFFGNEQLATGYNSNSAPIFSALLDSGYNIELLVLNQKSAKDVGSLAVGRLAEENGIPILCPQSLDDFEDMLDTFEPDFGVLAAYGKIIPKTVLESFPKGIINIHPSLLPKYRGPTPIEQAILDNQSHTGISIIKLAEKMDAGPVYCQEKTNIELTDTKPTLASRLAQLGAKVLINNLCDILSGALQPHPQNEQDATFCSLIKKDDGKINFSDSPHNIAQKIKAYQGWPKSTFEISNAQIIVLSAIADTTVLPPGKLAVRNKHLILGCEGGSIKIKQLQLPGKKPMDSTSFINGYGSKLQ